MKAFKPLFEPVIDKLLGIKKQEEPEDEACDKSLLSEESSQTAILIDELHKNVKEATNALRRINIICSAEDDSVLSLIRALYDASAETIQQNQKLLAALKLFDKDLDTLDRVKTYFFNPPLCTEAAFTNSFDLYRKKIHEPIIDTLVGYTATLDRDKVKEALKKIQEPVSTLALRR